MSFNKLSHHEPSLDFTENGTIKSKNSVSSISVSEIAVREEWANWLKMIGRHEELYNL